MSSTPILCPDIGNFKDVEVIEVLVKAGDQIEAETPLLTLETEKATMDVPSPQAGVISEVLVKKGGRVSQGTPLVTLEVAAGAPAAAAAAPKAAPAAPSATLWVSEK